MHLLTMGLLDSTNDMVGVQGSRAWAQLELVAQYWSGYLPSAGEGGLLAGTPASTASSDACGRCCTSSRDVSHLLWGLDSHQSSARDLYLILLDF